MGKWAGAYRADKRRKEIERLKAREEKEKRLAERRALLKQGEGAPADQAPAATDAVAVAVAATGGTAPGAEPGKG
jgi:hypothetical protein